MKISLPGALARFLFFLLLIFSGMVTWAQVAVKGRITDEKTGGLGGATITVKGTQTATTSNDDGFFTIMAPKSSSVLVISSIGYVTSEVPLDNRTTINTS